MINIATVVSILGLLPFLDSLGSISLHEPFFNSDYSFFTTNTFFSYSSYGSRGALLGGL